MISLTQRQQDAIRFIARFQATKGFSPSRREISEALGLKSKASAHRLLMGLVDRGAIRILPFRTRAIELLVALDDAGEAEAPVNIGLNPRQQDALRFITGYVERNGIPPSKREIADGIGTARESTSYIQRILLALQAVGAVVLDEGQHRGITLLRPAPIPRAPDGEPLRFVPRSLDGDPDYFVRIGEAA